MPGLPITQLIWMHVSVVDVCALALSVILAAYSATILSRCSAICPGQKVSAFYVQVRTGYSQEDTMVYSVFPSEFLHSGYFVFMEFVQGHIITEANHSFGKARNNYIFR